MFQVDLRFLAEHAEELHSAYQQILKAGNEASSIKDALEALSSSEYPVSRLKLLQTEIVTAADRIRSMEKAAEEIASAYNAAEKRIDSEIEDAEMRVRSIKSVPKIQNISWIESYMNQIIY